MTPLRRDALLFASALLVRLVHLAIIRPGPLFRYLFIDSEFYDAVGRRLAEGQGFPEGVFFMNVLYGVFLGGVYSVFGGEEGGRLAALAIQAVLGAGSCVLVARLGAALDRPREGLAAGILLAVYGPAIFYDGALLTPSLLLFLTTAALLVAVRASAGGLRSAALLGILTGLLILGRANNALLLPVFLGLQLRRGRSGWLPSAALLGATAIVVLPVTIRNHAVSGEIVPVTANGGMALWAGNHHGATGIYSTPAFLSNPVPEREAEDYRVEASRREGRELTLAESSRYWTRATVRVWLEDPGRTVALALRKFRIYLNATESQTNLSYPFALGMSPLLSVFRLHFGWILPLAIVGMAFDFRRMAILSAPIGVSLITCLLFYVSSEYRHPVVPFFLLFAAAGGRVVHATFRERGVAVGRKLAIGTAVLCFLVYANYRNPFLSRLESRRVDNLNFGTLAFQAGALEEAESFLRRSIRIDPTWPPSRRKLAEVLQAQGRVREAGEEARRADLLSGVGPTTVDPRLAEANRLFREERFGEAREAFLAIAAAGDESAASSLNNAGLCSMRLGEAERADSLFVAAAKLDPEYVSPIIHRGRLALSVGDSSAAEAFAEEALAKSPGDGRAHRLLVRSRGEEPR